MRRFSIFILFPILIFNAKVNLFAQSEKDTLLYWSETEKLRWIDFLAKCPDSAYKIKQDAVTSTEILYKGFIEDNLPNFTISVYFRKKLSWAKDTSYINVLSHEQLHFDIAEVFGRKIRNQIEILREKKDNNLSHYQKVISDMIKAWSKRNHLYDKETNHGRNKVKQIEWNEKIAKELGELKAYEIDYSEYIEDQ